MRNKPSVRCSFRAVLIRLAGILKIKLRVVKYLQVSRPEIPTSAEDSNDEASWRLEKSDIQVAMEHTTILRGFHKFSCQIF